MCTAFDANAWAVVLGGSSGFGLASAHKLASHGMNIFIVHRDRRGAMARITPEFEAMRTGGARVVSYNGDALAAAERARMVSALSAAMGESGRVRVLLHSIAFGNLKLLAPEASGGSQLRSVIALARDLDVDERRLQQVIDGLFATGAPGTAALHGLSSPPGYAGDALLEEEDLQRTIHAMGTSLLQWTQLLQARGLFAQDARVLGLTSEGNSVAWKGYAAVAAAKAALESLSRAIAVELGPRGIRSNVVQAGITDTPALRLIPGSAQLKAQAALRNPLGRLTTPKDVANVVYLLCLPEAAWINGALVRVDGGEHVSGVLR